MAPQADSIADSASKYIELPTNEKVSKEYVAASVDPAGL